MHRLLLILVAVCACLRAEPPPGYYDSAAGLSGPELKAALHDIIDGHTVVLYENLFPPLKAIWEQAGDSSKVRLIYGSAPAAKSSFSWNREHLWPRSRGVNPGAAMDGGADDSDFFNIAPADADVNTARSNLYFDESSPSDGNYADPAHPEAPLCSKDGNSWEPPANEKGDIARSLFYMAVRYDGSDPNTTDLELVTGTPTGSQMANLPTLLAWHAADPPDAAERARNDLIFTAYQHNRNPFVDHPEWVQSIWGTAAAITVQAATGTATAFEAPLSNATITVILGSPAPAGGFHLPFSVSGTATGADHVLSGSGVTFNAASGSGSVVFPAGATVAGITVAPIADGIAEPAETVILTIAPGAGYSVVGGPAQVTISDTPPPPGNGVIALWNFNAPPFTSSTIPPSNGNGTLSTSGWGGGVTSFGGVTGSALALQRNAAGNGTFIELNFNGSGWTGLSVRYQTRRSSTGFTTGNWSWSTNGTSYTPITGNFAPVSTDVFELKTVNLAGIAALRNAPSIWLRYTLSGATSDAGNNRIDDLAIHGVHYSASWLARFPSLNTGHAGDEDGDSRANFLEWALDSDPLGSSGDEAIASGGVFAPDPADGYALKLWPSITFTRRLDAPNIAYTPQQATALGMWSDGCVLVSTVPGPTADSERATFRASIPISNGAVFLRVIISEH